MQKNLLKWDLKKNIVIEATNVNEEEFNNVLKEVNKTKE